MFLNLSFIKTDESTATDTELTITLPEYRTPGIFSFSLSFIVESFQTYLSNSRNAFGLLSFYYHTCHE